MSSTTASSTFPDFTPLPGGCYCKKVTYTLNATPIFVNCCHCHNCQTLTGSAFAINVAVETEHLHISPTTANSDLVVQDNQNAEGQFSGSSTRCAHCNTLITATHPFTGAGITYLRAGTLDDAGKYIKPDAHFFKRSMHSWVEIPEGSKAFDALPGENDTMFTDPKQQARWETAIAKGKEKKQG